MKGWKTKAGVVVGIIGVALLAGVEFAPTPDIATWLKFIGTIMSALGGGTATIGVAHKIEKSGNKGGVVPIVPILLFLPIFAALLLMVNGGCNGFPIKEKPYPQQIEEQGGTNLEVAEAAQLQAFEWYTKASTEFTKQVKLFPPSAATDPAVREWVQKVNGVFEEASAVLDAWDLALRLADSKRAELSEEEWAGLKYRLIHLGISLLVEEKE